MTHRSEGQREKADTPTAHGSRRTAECSGKLGKGNKSMSFGKQKGSRIRFLCPGQSPVCVQGINPQRKKQTPNESRGMLLSHGPRAQAGRSRQLRDAYGPQEGETTR